MAHSNYGNGGGGGASVEGKRERRSKSYKDEENVIRKGPWKEEEDQVLINHVNKYGPKDWSSIRSKGLLNRTGKSCRLRWVNKLRPNLKHGCKFTPEEERVVIELQAQFGNKWARIATHLPGRTDNDVKNFWSSRQKRLARLLHSSSAMTPPSPQGPKSVDDGEDNPCFNHLESNLEPQNFGSMMEDGSSILHTSSLSSYIDPTIEELIKMGTLPDFMDQSLLDIDHLELSKLPSTDKSTSACNNVMLQEGENSFFTQTLQDAIHTDFSPESQELMARLEDPNFMEMLVREDDFIQHEGTKATDDDPLAASDSFLNDFPMDMLDHIDSISSPSDS